MDKSAKLEIYPGKQYWIDNFDWVRFHEEYKKLSGDKQRHFIDSFNITTNPEWLRLKRGYLGASDAKDFLSDSVKVAGMKRTKEWPTLTQKERRAKLEGISLDDRLGESCKRLAYDILEARRTNWEKPEKKWEELTGVKRGLTFESAALDIYKRIEKLQDEDLVEISFVRRGDLMGFSPDRLVLKGTKKISLEIKNFEPAAYYKAVSDAEKPETICQVQWQIHVADLNEVHIIYCSHEDGTYKLVKYGRGINYLNAFEIREDEFREYLKIVESRINAEVLTVNCDQSI